LVRLQLTLSTLGIALEELASGDEAWAEAGAEVGANSSPMRATAISSVAELRVLFICYQHRGRMDELVVGPGGRTSTCRSSGLAERIYAYLLLTHA
jgi:hypothetical protein